MPVIKLPSTLKSSRQSSKDHSNEYQPTEFTLAKFSPDKSDITLETQGRSRNVPMSMQRVWFIWLKLYVISLFVLFIRVQNLLIVIKNPTPEFGRDSTILANRRSFDQPLGDQNLRPVHDGQYGLIAGTSALQDPYQEKPRSPDDDSIKLDTPVSVGINYKTQLCFFFLF